MGNSSKNNSDSDRKDRSDQGGKIRGPIGDAAIGQNPESTRKPPKPPHNPHK